MNSDEKGKGILYNNAKPEKSWKECGKQLQTTSTVGFHPKKVMLSIL